MIRAALVVLSLGLFAIPAYARNTATDFTSDVNSSLPSPDGSVGPKIVITEAQAESWLPPVRIPATSRPAALPALYISLAALQVFDVYSSSRGLAQGAREGNPLMQGIVNNPVAFWTIKAATTVAPMILAERLWKKNKVGAIAVMVIANGVAVAVAAQNGSVLK